MSETPPETPPVVPGTPAAPLEGQEEPKTFDAEYVEKLRKENAKHRTDAKTLAAELEKVRQSSMTDTEKAVAEAVVKGRTEATSEFGQRLARSEFDAAAGRRNPDVKTDDVLKYVDLSRFVGDDGEPDKTAIAEAVERLVPAPAGGPPNYDGGPRTPAAKPTDMNQIIRRAAGVVR